MVTLHMNQAEAAHCKSKEATEESNPPNTVPSAHDRFRATLAHRPLAPPARVAHSRRPFALPTRVARSRRPLAPQPALTGTVHGTGPSWSASASQYRPICTHPCSCLQRALLRGRLGHARRANTSGARGTVRAGAASRRHSFLLVQRRFGDARDVNTLLWRLHAASLHRRRTLMRRPLAPKNESRQCDLFPTPPL